MGIVVEVELTGAEVMAAITAAAVEKSRSAVGALLVGVDSEVLHAKPGTTVLHGCAVVFDMTPTPAPSSLDN